jgi:hypothetical protein
LRGRGLPGCPWGSVTGGGDGGKTRVGAATRPRPATTALPGTTRAIRTRGRQPARRAAAAPMEHHGERRNVRGPGERRGGAPQRTRRAAAGVAPEDVRHRRVVGRPRAHPRAAAPRRRASRQVARDEAADPWPCPRGAQLRVLEVPAVEPIREQPLDAGPPARVPRPVARAPEPRRRPPAAAEPATQPHRAPRAGPRSSARVLHEDALCVAGAICPVTQDWVRRTSRVPAALAARP